jgi:hypothetical protein
MKNASELLQDGGCKGQMPDGSPCHACRLFDALLEAEAVLGHDIDHIDQARCLAALHTVTGFFMADLDDQSALKFVATLYSESRMRRAELEAMADPINHTAGNA